jgi:hypothetical protein
MRRERNFNVGRMLTLNDPPDMSRGGSLRTSAFRGKPNADMRGRSRRFSVGRSSACSQ